MSPLIRLGLVVLAAASSGPASSSDDLAVYQGAAVRAGRDADAQVRLALWCEAHGLRDERETHLALALAADPDHVKARGLLGQVADGDRWVRPEAVANRARTDAELAANLADYNERRARTPQTQEAQWELGLWCERHGLEAEATAHFTAVTRLAPRPARNRGIVGLAHPDRPVDRREAAWKRLGYRRHDGRWMTAEQIQAERDEAEAQAKADRHWHRQLTDWKGDLAHDRHPDETEAALAGVADPRAVPSIWKVFATGGPADQGRAVQLLGQIEAPAASSGLVALAIFGRSEEVRRAAAETLRWRDPREFVGTLIGLVHRPIRYEFRPVGGPGSRGELFIEGERYNLRRRYAPPRLPGRDEEFLKEFGLAGLVNMERLIPSLGRIEHNLDEVWRADIAARRRQMGDVAAIERTNAGIRQVNARALPILSLITGQDFEDDPDAWKTWWTDQLGYRYTPPKKPTLDENVVAYQAKILRPPPPHTACFAAGTPVLTLTGPRPIDSLRQGDLVLSQDTATGELGYQPVLLVHRNPPSTTLRLSIGGEAIVATGIHRFWKAGVGWRMARDLKPGDEVRALDGVARVESVQDDEKPQPVYNLDVARNRNFFVGKRGTLVHDFSLVEPTPEPFDAPPDLASAPSDRPAGH